jgi:plastocyanin
LQKEKKSQIGGISIVSFIVVVVVSLTYYQFVFLPTLNAKPEVPEKILQPSQTVQVSIDPGSSQPSQTKNFEPKETKGVLGVSNKVVWTNADVTPHSVSTDNNYVDPINGKFDSLSSIGLIPPKGTFEYTFTKDGEYLYHCEPHPWMTGKVTIEKDFS